MPDKLVAWQTGDTHLRSPLAMRQYNEIADRVARDRPGRILDWGCGYGQITAMLSERGVDVASYEWQQDAPPTAVERPLERWPQYTALVSSDPVALPYPDASFDAAISVGVLEHVQDPDGSLEELARILRPGGRLYVYNLPNRYSWTERVAKRIGAYYHGKLPHDQVYTPASARAIAERHGFSVAEIGVNGMFPLSVPVKLPQTAITALWHLNRALSRVPGLNRIATAVEFVALRTGAGAS